MKHRPPIAGQTTQCIIHPKDARNFDSCVAPDSSHPFLKKKLGEGSVQIKYLDEFMALCGEWIAHLDKELDEIQKEKLLCK